MKSREKENLLKIEDNYVYTNNERTFNDLVEILNENEHGIAFKRSEEEMCKYAYVPINDSSEVVKRYKKVVRVIEITEAEKLKITKDFWQKVKNDILEFDGEELSVLGVAWALFGHNDLEFSCFLAFLALCLSIDFKEAYKLVSDLLKSSEQKYELDQELEKLGLFELTGDCESKNDVSMYLKLAKSEEN